MLRKDVPSPESDWIDLVISRALDLRKAGILAIGIDGFTASLAPYVEQFADDKATPPPPEHTGSVMDDPASYADGVVPGYVIEKFPADFEE
jgi:hypothetical protein